MPPGRQCCHWREHPAAWNHLATNHSTDRHGALMIRSCAVAALLSFTLNAWADGPGTRIRDTPLPSRPAAAVDRDLQRCEAMRGDEKERCLRALRDAARRDERAPHAGPGPERGPESIGMGSGAGSTGPGVGGGTTGGAGAR